MADGTMKNWDEAETKLFLLKIIDNLGNGKAPKLSEISMPGRSTKALSHRWNKVKQEAAAAAAAVASDGEPATPKKRNAKSAGEESPAKKKKTTPKKKKVEPSDDQEPLTREELSDNE